jgi:hypothetical protein
MVDELKSYIVLFFKRGYYKYVLAVIAYFILKDMAEKSDEKGRNFIKENMGMGKAHLIEISPRNPKS